MVSILLKRFIRYCRENILLYSALLILVASVVTVVLSIECTAFSILNGRDAAKEYDNIEDGQFCTAYPLSDEQIEQLCEDNNVEIQQMFSFDKEYEGITYRIFANRTDIDRLSLLDGRKPQHYNEIVLDQLFAKSHDIELGDQILLGDNTFNICGIGSIPDYLHPTKGLSDPGVGVNSFTWAIINEYKFEDIIFHENENVEFTYSFKTGRTNLNKFYDDIDDLLVFIERSDNRRMDTEIKYAKLYKTMGFVVGVMLISMLALIFAVVTKGQVYNEHKEIGSLYALGITKKTIIGFYTLPIVIVTLLGGILGTVLGFSPKIVCLAVDAFHNTNSFPYYDLVKPNILYVYAILMPPVVSLLINYLTLNKALSRTALSLIRGEIENRKKKTAKLKTKNFILNFQIHRFLQDRSTIIVFFSVLVSISLFMLGLDTHYLAINNANIARENTKYTYLCNMRYAVDDLETCGEKIYIQSVKTKKYNSDILFSVVATADDSEFVNLGRHLNEGEAIAGDALSSKLGLRKGDKFVFTEGVGKTRHSVKIVDIISSNANLELYMNIDAARNEFDREDDYYNAVLFDTDPDIDSDYIYSTIDKDSILDSFEIMEDTMKPFMRLAYIGSTVIAVSTMLLIVSTMIDRCKTGISLFKIMGYRNREVQRMYVYPVAFAVALALAFAIPVSKLACDAICPSIYKDLPMGMFFQVPYAMYIYIFVGVMVIFICILQIILIKIGRVSTNEVLKNRE